MNTVTKEAMTAVEHAGRIARGSRGSALFQSKALRDEVAAFLKAEGWTVKKRSVRNYRLHPEYVADFVGTYETGFGNCDYMTHWSRLYGLEVKGPTEF
jgi:hypothetical protein